jgi:hypothetical protein
MTQVAKSTIELLSCCYNKTCMHSMPPTQAPEALAQLPEQLHLMASKCPAAAAAAIQLMQAMESSASATGISRMHVLPVEYLQVKHIRNRPIGILCQDCRKC